MRFALLVLLMAFALTTVPPGIAKKDPPPPPTNVYQFGNVVSWEHPPLPPEELSGLVYEVSQVGKSDPDIAVAFPLSSALVLDGSAVYTVTAIKDNVRSPPVRATCLHVDPEPIPPNIYSDRCFSGRTQ